MSGTRASTTRCCCPVDVFDCAGNVADAVLTPTSASTQSTSLGGIAALDRVLWSFTNDGSGCPAEVIAPAAPCTDTTIPVETVVLGALADGTVGWVRPSTIDRVAVRSVTAATTVDLTTDAVVFANANAGNFVVTLPTPVAGNLCEGNRITVKRTDNNPLTHVRVTAAAGIDGAPTNNIQLGTSTAFGAITGESATFVFDGTTWRIV